MRQREEHVLCVGQGKDILRRGQSHFWLLFRVVRPISIPHNHKHHHIVLKCNHYNQLYVFRPCASVQYLEINVSKWRINSPRIMKSLMKRQMLFLIFSLKRGFYLREGTKKKIDFFLGKSPKLWVGGGQES